jgi:hypothetical protein
MFFVPRASILNDKIALRNEFCNRRLILTSGGRRLELGVVGFKAKGRSARYSNLSEASL